MKQQENGSNNDDDGRVTPLFSRKVVSTTTRLLIAATFVLLSTCVLLYIESSNLSAFVSFIAAEEEETQTQIQTQHVIRMHGKQNQTTTATILPSRNVTFLSQKDWHKLKEAYSGMWWQSTERFLQTEWVHFHELELASFKAFRRGGRVRKTRDWLDLAVTHLSVYWKHFPADDDNDDNEQPKSHSQAIALGHVQDHLNDFIRNATLLPVSTESAAPETIAVLPFVLSASTNKNHTTTTNPSLPETALHATLVSLWQVGMGRCVVVVGEEKEGTEREVVQRVFANLRSNNNKHPFSQRPIQLQLVSVSNLTKQDRRMMPRVALRGLQLALRGNLTRSETQEWLGAAATATAATTTASANNTTTTTTTTSSLPWKFVYFTEPDLILHARPSAMKALHEEMMQGRAVLSAHRFQPLPHQDHLPNYPRVDQMLPHNFAEIVEMNVLSEQHSCCDAGKYYPSNARDQYRVPLKNNRACRGQKKNAFWWQCGFGNNNNNQQPMNNVTMARQMHPHLREYSLIRIQSGTVFPLVDNHQRTCRFHSNGRNCADDDSVS